MSFNYESDDLDDSGFASDANYGDPMLASTSRRAFTQAYTRGHDCMLSGWCHMKEFHPKANTIKYYT